MNGQDFGWRNLVGEAVEKLLVSSMGLDPRFASLARFLATQNLDRVSHSCSFLIVE